MLIPSRVTRVLNNNDYDNPDSEFCHKRSKPSENFVLLWAKEYGDDPATLRSYQKKLQNKIEFLVDLQRRQATSLGTNPKGRGDELSRISDLPTN